MRRGNWKVLNDALIPEPVICAIDAMEDDKITGSLVVTFTKGKMIKVERIPAHIAMRITRHV